MKGIVYDKFAENTKGLEHGKKPWYDSHDKQKTIFPGEMFLISKDKFINYDIRSDGPGSKFNIVSSGFLGILKNFSVPVREVQPISIVNSKGKNIVEKTYFTVSFSREIYQKREDVLNADSALVPDELGSQFIVEKLSIRHDCNKDLFKIGNIYSGQDAIFCSEKFMDEAIIKKIDAGIEFRNVEVIQWTDASPDNFLGFLVNDTEPLLFIH